MSENQQLHRFRDRAERFVKERADAPAGFFDAEAAGLRWLAEVVDGVPVPEPLLVRPDRIELVKLASAEPSRDDALIFGERLAHTHDAGAPAWGAAPDGYRGPCFIGDRAMSTREHDSWGEFYADERVEPYLAIAEGNGGVTAGQAITIRDALDAIRSGAFDDADTPSRLHGDLWAGNVMWTPSGVVLIDPAAHGGHRETDLAMLALFGLPYLDEVIAGYEREHPLAEGWQQRVPMHQMFPLATHTARFGPTYGRSLVDAARSVLAAA